MGTKELSATAYLICWGRSKDSQLSLDPYANLWLTKEGRDFSEKFTDFVSPLTPYLFSLRSHYIVSLLKQFEQEYTDPVIVNVGSGVTSYPFLLNENTTVINIDQPHVLEFYKEKVSELVLQNKLPQRNIVYEPIDLNSHEAVESISQIVKKQKRPAFVIFEGILTYLHKDIALKLVSSCASSCEKSSRLMVHVGLDYFCETDVWQKIENFFLENLGLSIPKLTLFSEKELISIPSIKLVEHIGFKDMDKRFGKNIDIPDEDLIDERFFLFEKE